MGVHVSALLMLAVAFAVFAPAAEGATARMEVRQTYGDECRYDSYSCRYDVLVYAAEPGERNTIEVVWADGRRIQRTAAVRDPGAEIVAGPGCTAKGSHEVECTSDISRLNSVEIAAGDLDDSMTNAAAFLHSNLRGGRGNDELTGGRGTDWLDGGPGSDSMAGNEGDDTVDYSARNTGVFTDLANPGPIAGAAGERDSVQAVERVRGGRGPDILRGSSGTDVLYGRGGGDRISGRDGDDGIFGGDGRDRLHGNDGPDLVDGGQGPDVVRGGCGEDTLDGSAGNDRIYAFDGARDEIYGERGTDFAEVDRGFDDLTTVERVRRRTRGTCPG